MNLVRRPRSKARVFNISGHDIFVKVTLLTSNFNSYLLNKFNDSKAWELGLILDNKMNKNIKQHALGEKQIVIITCKKKR